MFYVNRKNFNRFILILFVMTAGILAFGFRLPADTRYLRCYWVNAFYLLFIYVVFGMQLVRGKFDLYDPITSFSLFYVLMFFVAPMHSVVINNYYAYGVDVFPYAIKGSAYAFAGYISFYVLYVARQKGISTDFQYEQQQKLNKRRLPVSVFLILGIWITLAATLLYQVRASGNSAFYILTLGILGRGGITSNTSDIGFLGFLSFALPSFVLLYMEYGKNKTAAILFLALTFLLKTASGFRWNIVQMVVMFGSYYFLRTGKKIKLKALLLILLLLIVPIFLMSMFRNSIRAGHGIDFSLINAGVFTDVLENAFWNNLDIYKSYYSLMSVVPGRTGYLYGKQILIYTAIILIPRAIWPGKPGNPGTLAQGLALGQAAVLGGYAYPCLGEYYYDSGLFGILFYTGLFGFLAAALQNKYRYRAKTEMDLMIFCTVLSQIIQLVIRGYMPTNFWRLIVSVIPYWLFRHLYYVRST